MYELVMSAKSVPGKGSDSNAWMAETVSYLNKTCLGASPWRGYREFIGERDTLYFTSGWENLTDVERAIAFWGQDEGAVKRARQWSEWAVPGSGVTRVLIAL